MEIDLTSLRLREARGETIDVMQEFVSQSANHRFGAEHFLQTFSFALKESADINDFQWRCTAALSPDYVRILDEQVWMPSADDKRKSMIGRYSGRLAYQLGQFALRRPDEAANAAVAWSQSFNTLILSEAISLPKMHLIRNRGKARLEHMKKQGEGAGSADAVAAFIVLSNIAKIEKKDAPTNSDDSPSQDSA